MREALLISSIYNKLINEYYNEFKENNNSKITDMEVIFENLEIPSILDKVLDTLLSKEKDISSKNLSLEEESLVAIGIPWVEFTNDLIDVMYKYKFKFDSSHAILDIGLLGLCRDHRNVIYRQDPKTNIKYIEPVSNILLDSKYKTFPKEFILTHFKVVEKYKDKFKEAIDIIDNYDYPIFEGIKRKLDIVDMYMIFAFSFTYYPEIETLEDIVSSAYERPVTIFFNNHKELDDKIKKLFEIRWR